MKKQNKTPFILFLSLFIIISALSISAYSGLFKSNPNKIKQTIAPPKGGGPIQFSSKLDNDYYYDNNSVYLYIDLRAEKVKDEKERSPLNIAIVIDKSGSMGEKNKLEYVKKAVDYIIDQVDRDDYISVITYDDYVNIVQRSGVIRDKYDLRDKISRIKPDGFTNLSEGMFEGYDQVNGSYSRGYVNRVLLLSDGLANRGVTDRYKLADIVRDKNRRDGVTISTFGVGNDFNENLMADIADYGKGNYYYIRNSSDIPEIFASELKGIRNLVGQGTKMRVKFPSRYLSLAKVFGYPYELSGDEIINDFKDVFSEETKSVLIKYDITHKIDSRLSFASELTYEDVNSNFRTVTENGTNMIEPAKNREEYLKNSSELVQQNISVFESNEMMENALREADNGDYDKARMILKDATTYMEQQMGQVQSSPEMKRQSENMEKYGDDLKSAETKSDEEKKEMQKSGKYDNYNSRKSK
jgi:Ca-activated chloride channel family protein